MRNDTQRWNAPVPLARDVDGIRVTEVVGLAQHWVSGRDVLARYADQLIAWSDIVKDEIYALSLRRDRVLVVGGVDLALGYTEATGLAVTDVSDAYAVIDVTGPNAFASLRRGGEIRLDLPSRSVVRRLFGSDVLLYRLNAEDGFRLHVERAQAQSFVDYLCH